MIHIANLPQDFIYPKKTFLTMCWQKFKSQIPMIIQNFFQISVLKKYHLIICQALGAGQYIKIVLMRLVFQINEK